MKNNKWVFIATLGGIGFFPYGVGTIATAASILFLALWPPMSLPGYLVFLIANFFLAYVAINKSLFLFDVDDPACIVIDEYIGTLVTFLGISLTMKSALIGFLLFRFFDISKWCGINRLEKIPGAWGIILDDVGAGLIANIILRLLFL